MNLYRAEGYGSTLDMPKFILLALFPKLCRALGVSFLPSGTAEFFSKILRQTVEQRRSVDFSMINL